jgi:hypothetical protein
MPLELHKAKSSSAPSSMLRFYRGWQSRTSVRSPSAFEQQASLIMIGTTQQPMTALQAPLINTSTNTKKQTNGPQAADKLVT